MPYTSNKKINALDLAPAPLGDTDAVPMVRAGVTFQTPLSAVEAKVFSSKTALSTAPLGTEVVVVRQGDGSLRQTTTSSLIPDGNITNTQIGASAAISDTKLATIATAGKVSNSATTATSANTANAIVARDGSGDFSARTITATQFVGPISGTITGNAATATALQTPRTIGLSGAVTATGVNFDGTSNIALTTAITALPDSSLATIATAGKVANSATTATSINAMNSIVARDGSGHFTAANITANQFIGPLNGNANTASSATTASTAATLQTSRTIAISGDVTGTATGFNGSANITIAAGITPGTIDNADISATAAIADTKLAQITSTNKVANSATTATSTNAANTIVARDASGNFSAGTISAGTISATTVSANLTGTVTGNASGLSSPASNGLAKAFVAFTAPPSIASTSITGSTTTMTATKLSHNLNTGDQVTIFNQTGNNVVLNGTWPVTRTDANNFTFVVTTAPASAISGLSITVYPVKIYSSWNIAKVAPAATNTTGSYDVTFSNGLTFPTYTTFTGSTATTSPAYWVIGGAEAPESSGAWPQVLRVSSDEKTSTGFRVKATYSAGTGSVTSVDWDPVFLSVYGL